MLTLADPLINPEFDCTGQQFDNGISILTVHCGSGNIVDLVFRSAGRGSCLVFNFGHPLSVKQGGHTYHFGHMQCNAVMLEEGRFRLSQEGKGNWLVYLITLQPPVYSSLLGHFKQVPKSRNTADGRLFPRNLYINEEISQHLYRLEQENIRSESAAVRAYGRLLVIWSLQLSQYGAKQDPRWTEKPRLIDEKAARVYLVERIIRTDFITPYTLRELARLSGTNECYLKRDFKMVFGMPVYAYQRKLKMELANDLLLNTTKSIHTVSKQLGYKYITHFTAAFRRYYGITPGKLRETIGDTQH